MPFKTGEKVFLRHVEIHVAEPLKSQKFYEDVRGFTTEEVQGGGKFIWMRAGDASILLRPGKGEVNTKSFYESPNNMVLCCDNPIAQLQQMKSKGLEVRGADAGCPTFTDPDGNWFQLIGPDGLFPAAN